MPAATADTLTLTRVVAPAPTDTERPVRRVDPFVHMDQMGEVEYSPGEPKGTDWHPHRGFES